MTLICSSHGWGKDPKHNVGQGRVKKNHIVAAEVPCISPE